MRKSTIFISAVLTTLALVMLYGVVSAYRSYAKLPESTPLPTETAIPDTPEPDPTLEPAATQVFITPEQAAQLAAQVVGNPNLFSAESWNLNTMAHRIRGFIEKAARSGVNRVFIGLENIPNMLTRPRELRKTYLHEFEQFCDRLRIGCEHNNTHYVQVNTAHTIHEVLSGYLAFRLRMGRSRH